jgi:endonuclease-3
VGTQLNKIELIQDYFDELYPEAHCELTYHKDYEFLIAVMFSAQCTDKKVNKVTDVLFSKYKTLNELDLAPIEDIESIIKPLGLYKNKAKNLKGICRGLLENFNGIVPDDKLKLTTLPGVGTKTANVCLIELFKIPAFPVDTHVRRVSNRLGLVSTTDVSKIEIALMKQFPKEKRIKLHHQFIFFGRYYCKALSPNCANCKIRGICKEKCKNL